jgi:alcohol dehydrogenase class IV
VICIPTTSGTGSEVSPVAVVTDPDRFMKVGIATRRIIPKWAVVDPSLVISCPPHVTSHSGMDALSHAIESYCAKVPEGRSPHAIFVGKNPASDALAMQAIKLIAKSLPTAVNDPAIVRDAKTCRLRVARRHGVLCGRNCNSARSSVFRRRSDAHIPRTRQCRSDACCHESHSESAHP